MHNDKRVKMNQDRYASKEAFHHNKTIVMGMLDRDLRQVRAKVIPNVKRETLQAEVLAGVKYGSKVFTDEWAGYNGLRYRFVHDVIKHMETYVNGQVHTQGIENFRDFSSCNRAAIRECGTATRRVIKSLKRANSSDSFLAEGAGLVGERFIPRMERSADVRPESSRWVGGGDDTRIWRR